jgi:hypothetical protein
LKEREEGMAKGKMFGLTRDSEVREGQNQKH